MKSNNRRNFTRIPMVRSAQIIMPDNTRTTYPVRDISLTGIQLDGSTNYPLGIYCTVIIEEHLSTMSLNLRFTGRILRKTDKRIAIQLVGTDQRTFDLLQTIMLYESTDPVSFCEEFTDNNPINLYRDSAAVKNSLISDVHTVQ